jgi:hypothetical protein
MSNTDQGGRFSAPFSAAPDPGPAPDQGPSAAPPGMPSQQARQPYFLATPNRDPTQWGKPNRTLQYMDTSGKVPDWPIVPQPHDVNPLVHQISDGLSRFGSGNVAGLAMAMGIGRGNFLKEFMAARKWKSDMEYETYVRNAQQLADTQMKEAIQAGEAISTYSDDTPKMWAELRQIAAQNNDTHLAAAIATGKVDNVNKLLQYRDNHLQPLLELNKARTSIEAERARIESEHEKASKTKEDRRLDEQTATALGLPVTALPRQQEAEPSATATTTSGTTADPDAAERAGRLGGISGGGAGTGTTAPDDSEKIDTGPAWMGGDTGGGAAPPAEAPGEPPAASEAPLGPGEGPPDDTGAPPEGSAPPPLGSLRGAAAATPSAPAAPAAPAASGARSAGAPGLGAAPGLAAPGLGTASPIRDAIDDALLGGKGTIKTGRKNVDTAANTAVITGTAQARQRLRDIYTDRSLNGLPPDQRRAAVLARVNEVSPRLAQRVNQLVSGQILLSARQAQQWETAVSLAGLADPSFNQSNPQQRALTVRQFTYGQMGRNMLSYAVVNDHSQQLREAIEELRPYQTNSPLWNRVYQAYYENNPFNESDPDVMKGMAALRKYDNIVHNVSPEIERAITGGQPRVTATARQESSWSPTVPADVLLQQLDGVDKLMIARQKRSIAQFQAAIGNSPAVDLVKLWSSFAGSGSVRSGAFEGEKIGAEWDTSVPTVGGGVAATMQRMAAQGPPQRAISILLAHPETAAQFDSTFPGWRASDFLGTR